MSRQQPPPYEATRRLSLSTRNGRCAIARPRLGILLHSLLLIAGSEGQMGLLPSIADFTGEQPLLAHDEIIQSVMNNERHIRGIICQ
jgi:hypothetical protein